MPTVHGLNRSFNTSKVVYTAEELGLDYDFVALDFQAGETKTPEHMARHPLGKAPTLTDGDNTLFESGAICRYLASKSQSALYPTDLAQRAQVDQWMNFFSIHPGRWIGSLLWERYMKPSMGIGEPNESAVKEAIGFLDQQMAVVDNQLASNDWLAGNAISLADLFAFAYVETTPMCDYSLRNLPNVQKWHDKLASRESVAAGRKKLGTG